MSFRRNRNVITFALTNLREECQQVGKGLGPQTDHTRQHMSPLPCGKGERGWGKMRDDEVGEAEGVVLTDS